MTQTPLELLPVEVASPVVVIRRTPAVWLATGLGVGFSPLAPGTLGAAVGLPVAWAIGHLPVVGQIALILSLLLVGIPLCTAATRDLGGRKDPGAIVYDEIITLAVTFFLVPMHHPLVIVAGFGLHRLFDITKPPPARQLERLPRGLGIMADDVAAGIYSCGALHLLLWLGLPS